MKGGGILDDLIKVRGDAKAAAIIIMAAGLCIVCAIAAIVTFVII